MIRLAAAPTLGELAAALGGALDAELLGLSIEHVASAVEIARDEPVGADANEARRGARLAFEPSTLVPILSRRHLDAIPRSRGPFLVSFELGSLVPTGQRWIHEHGAWALAGVLDRAAVFSPSLPATERVAKTATIAPGAVVMSGATIGAHSVIEPNAVVYDNVVLGSRVRVGAGAVIGRPGFGWATGPGGQTRRIPQLGGVLIDDDVDIGPLVTVDAGTLAPTRIKRGARIDAHVHVGHNVEIGESVVVAAQSGFAGSVRIERDVQVGGQVGVADHVVVGRGARLAAKAGVIGDVPSGRTFAGYPAVDRGRWLRAMAKLLRRPSR